MSRVPRPGHRGPPVSVSAVHGERDRDDGRHVLLAGRGIEYPLTADVGRVARRDLEDAQPDTAHGSDVTAETFRNRGRTFLRVRGGKSQCGELRVPQLRREVSDRPDGY